MPELGPFGGLVKNWKNRKCSNTTGKCVGFIFNLPQNVSWLLTKKSNVLSFDIMNNCIAARKMK